jgi:aldehyde dehydrogenase (NAD+)
MGKATKCRTGKVHPVSLKISKITVLSCQVCVAPNHVFVQEQHQSALVEAFKKAYDSFWPKGPLDSSSEIARLVNTRHFERNKSLLSRTKGKVAFGGQAGQDLRIEPAIVTDVTLDDPLMEESVELVPFRVPSS